MYPFDASLTAWAAARCAWRRPPLTVVVVYRYQPDA